MADPVVAEAEKVVNLTVAELKALIAAPPSSAKAFIAGLEAEASAAVAKVKSLGHVLTFFMSAAALALHFVKYLP